MTIRLREEKSLEQNKEQKNQSNVEQIEEINKDEIQKNEEKTSTRKETREKQQKNKTRRRIVLAVLTIAMVVVYIIERGYYLEIKEIGENYVPIFWQNITSMGITAILNFIAVFSIMYTTTKQIKRGLKVFFEDEKKEMPKLPQKSIRRTICLNYIQNIHQQVINQKQLNI